MATSTQPSRFSGITALVVKHTQVGGCKYRRDAECEHRHLVKIMLVIFCCLMVYEPWIYLALIVGLIHHTSGLRPFTSHFWLKALPITLLAYGPSCHFWLKGPSHHTSGLKFFLSLLA